MPKKGRWYEEEFMEYYELGFSTREICNKLGIGENAGYKFLQSKGLKSHAHKPMVITQEQIEQIKKKYVEENKTIEDISRELQIKQGTVNYWLRKFQITRPNGKSSDCNHNYFKEINTPSKAYFLGLLYADGGFMFSKKSDTYTKISLGLELKEEDRYIIEEFKKQLESGLPIEEIQTEEKYIVNGKEYNFSKRNVRFRVTCKELIQDLFNLGCGLNKTYNLTGIPNIPEEFKRFFILGFYDGDGIAAVAHKKRSSNYMGFCGTYEMMKSLSVYLHDTLNLSEKEPYYNKFNHIYYLQYNKYNDIIVLFDYFYKNLNIPYLTRKEIKMKEYIESKKL